jgi:hypothetical protein
MAPVLLDFLNPETRVVAIRFGMALASLRLRWRGFEVQERSSCRGLTATSPHRLYGRIAKTIMPALLDFLNPEP